MGLFRAVSGSGGGGGDGLRHRESHPKDRFVKEFCVGILCWGFVLGFCLKGFFCDFILGFCLWALSARTFITSPDTNRRGPFRAGVLFQSFVSELFVEVFFEFCVGRDRRVARRQPERSPETHLRGRFVLEYCFEVLCWARSVRRRSPELGKFGAAPVAVLALH